MKVAIQGHVGSYHQAAAERYFGKDVELVPCETFAGVFDALATHQAGMAVIAAENSIAGTAHPVYDLLLAHNFFVVGEVYEHIHHCLIGLPGAELEKITRVFSQDIALPQCDKFLEKNLPNAERVEYSDTAASVEHIKKLGDPAFVAIASERAAKLHDMQMLAMNIEDFPNNVTRFLVLAPQRIESKHETDKASVVLETAHTPGALWEALGVFADQKVNLTKLESRPIAHTPWRYQFLVDVTTTPEQLTTCIQKLEEQTCNVRVLGEYAASIGN